MQMKTTTVGQKAALRRYNKPEDCEKEDTKGPFDFC